jgi:hypothetical protein
MDAPAGSEERQAQVFLPGALNLMLLLRVRVGIR